MASLNNASNASTKKNSRSFPISYKTKYLCWCAPGTFSDKREIRGELIDLPPYKDKEFEAYVRTDKDLKYMEHSTRAHYIFKIEELLKDNKFQGLNPLYVSHSFANDKFAIITYKVIDGNDTYDPEHIIIVGIISGNFAHYYSDSAYQTIVFKRSAMINLVIARNNHSGSGTNMVTKYLRMLQNIQVNVCFLKAVPEAVYFYFKYGFSLFSSYRDEKRGNIADEELFAIDLIDFDFKDNYPTMQRGPSTNVSHKRKQNQNSTENKLLNNAGLKLLPRSPHTSFFYDCLNSIEQLKSGERWPLLNDVVTFESKKIGTVQCLSSAVIEYASKRVKIYANKQNKPNNALPSLHVLSSNLDNQTCDHEISRKRHEVVVRQPYQTNRSRNSRNSRTLSTLKNKNNENNENNERNNGNGFNYVRPKNSKRRTIADIIKSMFCFGSGSFSWVS